MISRPHQSQHNLRSVVVALVLVIFGGGPFFSALHLLTVDHGTCPEDGELIELDHGARATAGSAASATAVTNDLSRLPDGAHAHHHCVVAAMRAALTARPKPIVLPSAALIKVRTACLDWRETARPPAVPVFRLAPKSSPPAVAFRLA